MNPNCRKRMGAIRLENMKVIVQEEIAPAIFELVLEGEMVEAMKAGQFLHFSCVVQFQSHLLIRLRNNAILFIELKVLVHQSFQP